MSCLPVSYFSSVEMGNIPDIGSKNTICHMSICSPECSRRPAAPPPIFFEYCLFFSGIVWARRTMFVQQLFANKSTWFAITMPRMDGSAPSITLFAGVTPPSILSPFRSTTPRRLYGRRQVHRPCSGCFRIRSNWYQFHHH